MIKKYKKFNIHLINGHIQNIYIAEYPEKLLLLDGACRSDTKIIYNYITKTLKRNISDLKISVVSHVHPDHIGAALMLRKKYKIPIVAYENIDKCYKGIGGFMQHKINISLAWFVVFKKRNKPKSLRHKRFAKPDFKAKNNDNIPFFTDWQILHTPGHTGADISLYNSENQILYVADSVVGINGRLFLPFPIAFPEALEKTMLNFSKLKISELLLAHGEAPKIKDFSKLFIRFSRMVYNRPKGYFKFIRRFVRLTKHIRKNKLP